MKNSIMPLNEVEINSVVWWNDEAWTVLGFTGITSQSFDEVTLAKQRDGKLIQIDAEGRSFVEVLATPQMTALRFVEQDETNRALLPADGKLRYTPPPWNLQEHGIVAHWNDGTLVQVTSDSHTRFAHTLKESPEERQRVDDQQRRMAAEARANLVLMSCAPEMIGLLKTWLRLSLAHRRNRSPQHVPPSRALLRRTVALLDRFEVEEVPAANRIVESVVE